MKSHIEIEKIPYLKAGCEDFKKSGDARTLTRLLVAIIDHHHINGHGQKQILRVSHEFMMQLKNMIEFKGAMMEDTDGQTFLFMGWIWQEKP